MTRLLLAVCLMGYALLVAASCTSGTGQSLKGTNEVSRKLDEAKAKQVLEQYLATANGKQMGKLSPFFPEGNRVDVNFTYLNPTRNRDYGFATFRLAQDGKWYLAMENSIGSNSYPNLEIK